jgi:hypothetical protein
LIKKERGSFYKNLLEDNMGLGSMVAGAALDAASKRARLTASLKGRTPEQQKVIKYFAGEGGCLKKKGLSDGEYESMVMAKVKSINFDKKALDKIGLDESQVNEVPPVHFENYYFGDDKRVKMETYERLGKDGVWRSSAYQVSRLFFSSTQVYVYQYTFSMNEDGKNERTGEYFYKDVTNFSTTSDVVDMETFVSKGCTGKLEPKRDKQETTKFTIIVPGDEFYCSMKQSDYAEKAIQGMKAKLREKKG